MPTFVYLPGAKRWINMTFVTSVVDGGGDEPLVEVEMEDQGFEFAGTDRDVLLKALSKLTPKELT